jgi:hypothetical protein
MKLNKSITGLVILTIFILSSCSQSRYSSRMVRVKSNHVAQNDKQVDRAKKDAGIFPADKSSITELSEDDKTNVVSTFHATQIEPVLNSEVKKADLKQENNKTLVKNKKMGTIAIKNMLDKQAPAKRMEQIQHKLEQQKIKAKASGEDVDSLIYLILVVVLILLVLSLLLKLLPVFSGILGLALLILLIYVIIQLL